jgi:hypothetical protein
MPKQPLLNVLGTVAKHLIDVDPQFIRADGGEHSVNPHPAARRKLDRDEADRLTGRQACQRVTATWNGVHRQQSVVRVEEAGVGEKGRDPQSAFSVAAGDDNKGAVGEESAESPAEIRSGEHPTQPRGFAE